MFSVPAAETAPPNFLQRLQSSTVRQGSQVRLDVKVTGIPTPVVKFYREGAEIQSSADFRILQEGDLYSLLIAEAFPEDSGTYSATATNSSGRATSTAELLVQGETSTHNEFPLNHVNYNYCLLTDIIKRWRSRNVFYKKHL